MLLRVYWRLAVSILLRRPYKLSLLVSGGCNLRCQICSLWQAENTTLGLQDVRSLWEAFSHKPCWINISGGEPTLNQELESILSFFVDQDRPLLITLTTNGYRDCSPIIRRLLERNRQCAFYVSVSLDGEADEHDLARGLPKAHANAWRTYQRLLELGREFAALQVGISTTISRVNYRQVVGFLERSLAERAAVSVNLAQSSDYYRNDGGDAFTGLPRDALIPALRRVQQLLPKWSLDSILKVAYLEQAIQHLEGRYRPIPCTSYRHNVLVTSELQLVDCTVRFRPWPAGAGREERLAALVQAIRQPAARTAAIQAAIRESGCEARCHTPCEKYVHNLGALFSPRHAPRVLWTYLRHCFASGARRRSAGRISREPRAAPAIQQGLGK